MARNAISRQREFELMVADARRKRERLLQRESTQHGAASPYSSFRGENTMEPQEDVVEQRRARRKHVTLVDGRTSATRNILAENILLLVLLVASIYGLYRLSIYILNQS